ncbi:hypothetical protein SDC9_196879 [bioreactor metagenome]|uniref:Uncharacterized protein n=1 Tax=bioreactor metagenome TaxID=1076179 RepID=A0A645ILS4_9ZZZZ
MPRHGAHLVGDRSVFAGQIGMVGPGVHDAQHMPGGGHVERDRLDERIRGVGEVDMHNPAE